MLGEITDKIRKEYQLTAWATECVLRNALRDAHAVKLKLEFCLEHGINRESFTGNYDDSVWQAKAERLLTKEES